jgi:phosphatidylglycerophosphatase A
MAPRAVKLVATFFYLGYAPYVPGSVASLAACCLLYGVRSHLLPYLLLTCTLLILGFLTAGKAERLFGKKDASCIVIDEAAGMFLCVVGFAYDLKMLVFAFCLFRLCDTIKPPPARALEKVPGSRGIMGDDIVAALYTNLILQVVVRLL